MEISTAMFRCYENVIDCHCVTDNMFTALFVTLLTYNSSSEALHSVAHFNQYHITIKLQGESKKVDPLRLSTIFSLGLSLFA